MSTDKTTKAYPDYPKELGEPWAWHFDIGDGSETVCTGYTAVCDCAAEGWKATPLYPAGWTAEDARSAENAE